MASKAWWLVAAAAVSFGTPAAQADWLVSRDGGRIETQGPWRVEGAKVLFTLKNGSLGILRKSEVDLDASAVATAEAVAKPAPEPADKKKSAAPRAPVMTLTDKDVPTYVEVPTAALAAPAAKPADPAAAPAAAPAPLTIDSWEKVDGPEGGIEIQGVLRNRGQVFEVGIRLMVTIVDAQGNRQEALGFLDKSSLLAGGTTRFRAAFPSSYDLAGDPTFQLASEAVKIGGDEPRRPAGEPGAGDAEPAGEGGGGF